MNNRPEWLFLTFAIAKIGAVLVPLNTRYRTDDVAYTVRQSDSGTWISVDRSGPVDYAAMLADVLPGLATQDPRAAAIDGFPRLRRLVVVGERRRARHGGLGGDARRRRDGERCGASPPARARSIPTGP